VIQMSHSDFSVLEIDYDVEVAQGKHEKKYDFIYAMTTIQRPKLKMVVQVGEHMPRIGLLQRKQWISCVLR